MASSFHKHHYANGSACGLTCLIETHIHASMLFQRNQVEEAISRAVGERSAKPSAILKARLKRLLDVDRKLTTASGPRFAFSAKAPEGKGAVTLFSFADACALFVGIRMLEHGWPQNFVVSSLRPVRSDLSRRHEAILRRSPHLRNSRPEPGEMDFGGPASDFLLVVSDIRAARNKSTEPYLCLFDSETEAFKFQLEEPGRSCSWFSLEGPARALHQQLLSALPRKRGRAS